MSENTVKTMDAQDQGFEIDIFALLETWKRHLSAIILLALIGGLVSYAVTLFFVTPKYQATATMFVVSPSANSAIDVSDLNLGNNLTGDYVALIKSRKLLERVLADTGDPLTASQLLSMLSVSNVSGTRILQFTVTSTSPQQAMRLANSFVKQSIDFLPYTMGIKDNIPREIDLAMLPTRPYNMNYIRNIAVGLAVGALIMMAFYALRTILNDCFDRSEDIEKLCGFAPLASIPENEQSTQNKSGYYYYYYSNAGKDSDKEKEKK